MNAIAAPKSSAQNRLEGFALTTILQGFPTFAATALLLKLARHEIAGGAVLLVVLASVLHGVFTPWLAPKFPKFLGHGYELLFFDAGLSFAREDREVARAADDIGATGDERTDAGAAGGGGGEYEVICRAVFSVAVRLPE